MGWRETVRERSDFEWGRVTVIVKAFSVRGEQQSEQEWGI